MPLHTFELTKELKELSRLFLLLEDLQEGLPFNGPRSTDESPLHYFQRATSECTAAQDAINEFAEFIKFKNNTFSSIWNQVVKWDMLDEGLGLGEMIEERSKMRRPGAAKNNVDKKFKKVMGSS